MSKKLIIHYACANLEPSVETPVTAISVYDLEMQKEYSFSLYEEQKSLGKVSVELLEESLFQKFYTFVAKYPDALWIHWHMNGKSYGFDVLEERYQLVYDREPIIIRQRVNFADMLFESYKSKCKVYPKMLSLFKSNTLRVQNILTGDKEAQAFVDEKYRKIKESSSQKVLAMANLYHKLNEGRLVTPCQSTFNLWLIIGMSIIGVFLWLLLKV